MVIYRGPDFNKCWWGLYTQSRTKSRDYNIYREKYDITITNIIIKFLGHIKMLLLDYYVFYFSDSKPKIVPRTS